MTATKSTTNLMETPLSLTAFGQKLLDQHGIKEPRDLSGMVPNLQLGTSGGDSGVMASIRGVSSTNFTELGDPAVAIHVDGVYQARPQAALALMYDLERVEVLRGRRERCSV